MVGVVAAVGGEVEGHRKALLTRGQVAPVERIGFRRRREARVLADGPRLVDVHRRIRAAHERRLTGQAVQRIPGAGGGVAVGGDVDGLDVDALRGDPVELLGGVAMRCGRGGRPARSTSASVGAAVAAELAVAAGPRRRSRSRVSWPEPVCLRHQMQSCHAPNRVSRSDSASTASIFGGQVPVRLRCRVGDGLLRPGQQDVSRRLRPARPRPRRRPRRA